MRYKRITPDIAKSMMDDYANGKSVPEICEKFGFYSTSVKRILFPEFRQRHNERQSAMQGYPRSVALQKEILSI